MPLLRRCVLYCGGSDHTPPELLRGWAASRNLPIEEHPRPEAVETMVLRGRGVAVFIEGTTGHPEREALLRRLKSDPFTAIVPVTILTEAHDTKEMVRWYQAGADEVLSPLFMPDEFLARLDAMVSRAERDVSVHPSTRLPGTNEIEREFRRRVDSKTLFAVCYADLDHFKEFNDRYSYYDGDRVIYILSRILHDVVRGLVGANGFVGHIGGDDFIFVTSFEDFSAVCTEILAVFDELVPLQYNEQDRRAGYFFGKDRRGQLHRVPLMTLSIGVVTNQHREFTHPAQVSELATEMKSYAKTLPGSVFVVDRRRGEQEVRSGPGGLDARNP